MPISTPHQIYELFVAVVSGGMNYAAYDRTKGWSESHLHALLLIFDYSVFILFYCFGVSEGIVTVHLTHHSYYSFTKRSTHTHTHKRSVKVFFLLVLLFLIQET